MSKHQETRDMFAAAALTGLVAAKTRASQPAERTVQAAWIYADMMMATRQQEIHPTSVCALDSDERSNQ